MTLPSHYDAIDGYSDGPLQTTFNTNADYRVRRPGLHCLGRARTTQTITSPIRTCLTPTKLKTGIGLLNRRRFISTACYAVRAQMFPPTTATRFTGCSRSWARKARRNQGKMNVNYDNLTIRTVTPPWHQLHRLGAADVLHQRGRPAAAGLHRRVARWQPDQFCRHVLRREPDQIQSPTPVFHDPAQWTNYPAFGIDHIPVLVSNQFVYSPAVNRLLQLAANMYDATTNNSLRSGKNYPSVFRPLFSRDANEFGVAGQAPIFTSPATNNVAAGLVADPMTFQLLSRVAD